MRKNKISLKCLPLISKITTFKKIGLQVEAIIIKLCKIAFKILIK